MSRLIRGTMALAIACCGSALTAQAQDKVSDGAPTTYVRLDGGWSVAGGAAIKDNDTENNAICGDITCGKSGKLNEIGSSYVASGGFGYRFSSMFRSDATLSYRGGYAINDTDKAKKKFKGDINVWAGMLSGYFDIPYELGLFKPYIGLGLGLSRITTGRISYAGPNTGGEVSAPGGVKYNPAWQIMLGSSVNIFENVNLDFSYRYFNAGRLNAAGGDASNGTAYSGARGKVTAQELMAGVRYDF
jgi:opacity protein-like surface antigen